MALLVTFHIFPLQGGQLQESSLGSDDLENLFLAVPEGSVQFKAGSQQYEISFKGTVTTMACSIFKVSQNSIASKRLSPPLYSIVTFNADYENTHLKLRNDTQRKNCKGA